MISHVDKSRAATKYLWNDDEPDKLPEQLN